MAFREVRWCEGEVVLRLWLRGKKTYPLAAPVGLDRETIRPTLPQRPKPVQNP